MRTYAKLHPDQHLTIMIEPVKRHYDVEGKEIPYQSSRFRREEGWYPLEHEPVFGKEYLEYDEAKDQIVIKKRERTPEVIETERQAKIKQQLRNELPDIILQNKDNPGALVQALCDWAKQIEVENETRRDPEAV